MHYAVCVCASSGTCGEVELQESDVLPRRCVLRAWKQVSDEHRGRGVGRRLLATVQRLAQATRMAALMLTVQISNRAALKFYTQYGCACCAGKRKRAARSRIHSHFVIMPKCGLNMIRYSRKSLEKF